MRKAEGWKLVLIAAVLGGAYVVVLEPSRRAAADGWLESYPDALVAASTSNRRVLLAFTSEACPACRRMEHVLSDASIISLLERMIPVRIDAWEERELSNRYQVTGLPTYIIVDAQGEMVASTMGYQSIEAFSRFLKRAVASS